MGISGRYEETVRQATWLAALAGLIASATAVLMISEELATASGLVVLSGTAVVSGTLTMPFFWRWLVPVRGELGIGRSVAAGALSAIVSSFVMLSVAVFTQLGDGLEFDVSMVAAVKRWAGTSLYFAIVANILVGWITIPLGMAASVLVTYWARRRLRED